MYMYGHLTHICLTSLLGDIGKMNPVSVRGGWSEPLLIAHSTLLEISCHVIYIYIQAIYLPHILQLMKRDIRTQTDKARTQPKSSCEVLMAVHIFNCTFSIYFIYHSCLQMNQKLWSVTVSTILMCCSRKKGFRHLFTFTIRS